MCEDMRRTDIGYALSGLVGLASAFARKRRPGQPKSGERFSRSEASQINE